MNIQTNLKVIVDIVKNIIPLKEAYLFGSYAYGIPNKDSDYDLYFIAENIEGSKYETIINIKKALRGIPQRPIDIILNTKQHFDYRKGNTATLEYKVTKDGVKLYG